MKKGTIATIIGIAIVIGLALVPKLANAGVDLWTGYCSCTNAGCGCDCAIPSYLCSCGQMYNHIEAPTEENCSEYWDIIRESDIYDGEDDDYVYFKGYIYDVQTGSMYAHEMGSLTIAFPKDVIQEVIDGGCSSN